MKDNHYNTDNDTIKEQIKSIRHTIYTSMNGICAEKIRQSGLKYKVVFGTDWMRIKEIAQNYEQNYELATALWQSDTRETKLIATLLCPANELSVERFNEWRKNITTTECAEIISMALLSKTPQLKETIIAMLSSDIELERITAYHTLSRIAHSLDNQTIEYIINNINSADAEILSASRAIENFIFTAINKNINIDIINAFVKRLNPNSSVAQSIIYELNLLQK